MTVKWETANGGAVAHGEGFGVSWQPRRNPTGGDHLIGCDHKDGETALVKDNGKGKPETYYILNGDWRSQYEALIPQGYLACKAFYDQNAAEHRSRWSEDQNDTAITLCEALEILTQTIKQAIKR
jgi:hypothetical protein